MKKNDFQIHADRSLSGLVWDGAKQQKVLQALDGKGGKPMRKFTVSLALALALILATTAVGFATGGFGILQYRPNQTENEAFTRLITQVGQEYENDYFSMRVSEVAFDGLRRSCVLEIAEKENAETVLVLPRVKARANGRELPVMIERGGFWGEYDQAFWVPNIAATGYDPLCAMEVGLYQPSEYSDGNFGAYAPADGPVTWEYSFTVLKPNWPIQFIDRENTQDRVSPRQTDTEWTDKEIQEHLDAYTRQFAEAYENHVILLDSDAFIVEYLANIPQADGVPASEKNGDELLEELRQGCEFFTVVDEFAFRFETLPQATRTAEALPTFALPDGFVCQVTDLNVSVDYAGLALRITREDGADASDYWENWDWEFVLLSKDAKTSIDGASCCQQGDRSLRYECKAELSNPVSEITIVPCRRSETGEFIPGSGDHLDMPWLVWLKQAAQTDEQRELSVTIPLK